jgi:hypothetical protein
MRPVLVGVLAAVFVAAGIAGYGSLTRAAQAGSAETSANIALIPGAHAPHYSDTQSIPPFPKTDAQLSGYHFTDLPVSAVTPAALQPFDTIVLYGQHWSDLSGAVQGAINDFSRTHKVIIWDADSTGAQDYGSFAIPFSTLASNENAGSHGSVVTFPTGPDPIASPDPGSPVYLDPSALVASTHLIGHMNVMKQGAAGWLPGLIAANTPIPTGGWVLAWAYGSATDHTGLAIYSGMDADAFTDAASPNYAVKELAIELGAPFQQTADTTCAPNCSTPPPPTNGGGSTGGGTGGSTTGSSAPTGLGAPSSQTFALCSLTHAAPRNWVRGRVFLTLATSVANGIHGKATTAAGKVVGSGVTTSPGHVRIMVDTKRLPSDRRSSLIAGVYVNAVKACSVTVRLAVDNRVPTLRILQSKVTKSTRRVTVRASENLRLTILSGHRTVRRLYVRAGKKTALTLSRRLGTVTLVLIDRAGNRGSHRLALR